MTLSYKPDPKLREAVLKDRIVLIRPDRAKKMDGQLLLNSEGYYHNILEALCGTQVWEILESLTVVEAELDARRNARSKGTTPSKS